MYYLIFLKSFSCSSLLCYCIDLFVPQLREDVFLKNKQEITQIYIEACPLVICNLIISKFIFNYIEDELLIYQRDDSYIKLFLCWIVLADIIFYIMHKLFHNYYLYVYIHSIHHKYKITNGICALYAHPIDYITTNILPLSLPLIILQPPDEFIRFIIIFSTTYTIIISHGGYTFLPKNHLLHHIKHKYNYGIFISDKVFQTSLE